MATGKVIQITGPVIDVEFPPGELPDIYNALEIVRPAAAAGAEETLVVEVQQHLGNNWVRAVAMSTTDGLSRGLDAVDTGAAITVPVGSVTLGRVFDVLGHPIDGKGAVGKSETLPIHRSAPGFDQMETETNDEYLFEPSPQAVLSRLLPHFVAVDIYRAVLENRASEQSAQMVAMRSATENAHELIGELTLVYNKTRQANITREMTEIASGAEALG